MFLWTHKASDLGDPDARKMWGEFKDLMPVATMAPTYTDNTADANRHLP
jgi:hypothetical protein